jgi:hypothetical protein
MTPLVEPMKAGTVTPAPMMTLKNGKALNIPRHVQTAQEAAEEKDDARFSDHRRPMFQASPSKGGRSLCGQR